MKGIGVASVLLVALGAACSRSRNTSPEETVQAFVAAMEQSRSEPAQRRRAFEYLSEAAQAGLAVRAQRASQLSGHEFEPWEMLAPGRWQLRFQFDPETLMARVEGSRAVVTVRGVTGGVADVPLVREGDRWRVDLDLPPMTSDRPLRDP